MTDTSFNLQPRIYIIHEGNQLYVQLLPDKSSYIKIINGSISSFGVFLSENEVLYGISSDDQNESSNYLLMPESQNATVEICNPSKISQLEPINTTPMSINTFLWDARLKAASIYCRGPNVMVVGDQNTGKSTLVKWLTNLHMNSFLNHSKSQNDDDNRRKRLDKEIFVLDLDIGQQSISLPGNISAASFKNDKISNGFSVFFGTVAYSDHLRAKYKTCLRTLMSALDSLQATNSGRRANGTIINTMGYIYGSGYQAILDIVEICRVSTIVVTGYNKELLNKLESDLKRIFKETKFNFYLYDANNCHRISKKSKSRRSLSISRYFQTDFGIITRKIDANNDIILSPNDVTKTVKINVFKKILDSVDYKPVSIEFIKTSCNRFPPGVLAAIPYPSPDLSRPIFDPRMIISNPSNDIDYNSYVAAFIAILGAFNDEIYYVGTLPSEFNLKTVPILVSTIAVHFYSSTRQKK